MKKIVMILIIAIILSTSICAFSNQSKPDQIQDNAKKQNTSQPSTKDTNAKNSTNTKKPVIKVFTDPSGKPLEYKEDNEIKGFSINYIKAV